MSEDTVNKARCIDRSDADNVNFGDDGTPTANDRTGNTFISSPRNTRGELKRKTDFEEETSSDFKRQRIAKMNVRLVSIYSFVIFIFIYYY